MQCPSQEFCDDRWSKHVFISVSTSFLLTSTSQRINTDCNCKLIFFWGILLLLWDLFLLSFAMLNLGLTTTQLKSHINLVSFPTTFNICTLLWLKLSVLILTSSPCHNWLLPASNAGYLTISLSNISFQDTYFCFPLGCSPGPNFTVSQGIALLC